MINRFERFSYAISEINRCWHKLAAEELAKYGLNSPHAVYLNTLYRYDEGITAARLAEVCGKDKADVSRMIAIMEKKGLVRREAVAGSLYRAALRLTEAGKEAAEHIRGRVAIAVEMAGGGLSEQEREAFYAALELITANLQALSRDGLPETLDLPE